MRVGIDLGTTYSLTARMDAEGRPALVPDATEPDAYHTPSVVHISGGAAFVGLVAEAMLEQDPKLQVVRFFKRQMGIPDPIYYDENGAAWYPEGISALVLKKLGFDVESLTHQPLEDVVITVPAHFNDPQRKSTLAAAALADISVLGLVEEPVAAALHYGVVSGIQDQVVLVYDFGGGTFDATAMSMDGRGVYVLAKTGITELGGKELDEKVGAMLLHQFERGLGQPLPMGARTLLELRRVSEEIKIELCLPNKRGVRKMVMLGGQAVEIEISRAEFDTAIQQYLEQTEAETIRCLREAGLRSEDVNALLLVGGSSQVPLVEERLRSIFNRPGQQVFHHEPSKAVAYGAAIHATQLAGEALQYNLPPELRGVSGYSVGVRTFDPSSGRVAVDTLIKKNMPIPTKVNKTYYTSRPNQERMVLDFVQFRDQREGMVALGQLTVGPLNAPRPNYAVEVTTEYREDGTVAVNAYDAQTGVELQHVFGRGGEDGAGHLAAQRSLVRATTVNGMVS
jgi:molecular chaperone DnaK (HSP70)